MKTKHNTIVRIATAAIAMIASAASSHAANRTLILLQENSNGKSYMTDILPAGPIRAAADFIIDGFAENSEALKMSSLALGPLPGVVPGPYQRFVNLTNADCTRAKLLDNLIAETNAGRTIDLAILGHGNVDVLGLHDGEFLLGSPSFNASDRRSIRSLLTQARERLNNQNFRFKLRLVYMCNCFGSTLNDDWFAIGAKTSVGSLNKNFMAEPMITDFWNDFVLKDNRVQEAAADAFAKASNIWRFVPGYQDPDPETHLTHVQDSRPVVLGNANLIFKDEFQMALGDSRTITVNANQTHKFPIYLSAGQTYTFSAGSNDKWTNFFGAVNVNANGSAPGPFDGGRRVQAANMMALCGERFTHPDGLSFIDRSGFSIGTSKTLNTTNFGFLNLFANDNILGYGDNGGSISVTIRRTR